MTARKKVPTTFGEVMGAMRLRLDVPAKPATAAPITAPNLFRKRRRGWRNVWRHPGRRWRAG